MSQPKRLGTKANDMSQAGLQILQLELDNLHAERAQRERKLDMLLGRLRKACVELDEDDNAAAAAAHPSLQHHRYAPLLCPRLAACVFTFPGTLKLRHRILNIMPHHILLLTAGQCKHSQKNNHVRQQYDTYN